jgi:methylated-DNA-[protein]-cysteine S-methyltransferase
MKPDESSFVRAVVSTPIGPMLLEVGPSGLRVATWRTRARPDRKPPDHPVLRAAVAELEAFFAGRPRRTRVPLDLGEGTAFQQRVWRALLDEVGPGQLVTYGHLAARVGRPGAARAVGGAMSRNPVPIFVPCHRVVAAGGGPGGFTGGLARKRRLLACEGTSI